MSEMCEQINYIRRLWREADEDTKYDIGFWGSGLVICGAAIMWQFGWSGCLFCLGLVLWKAGDHGLNN